MQNETKWGGLKGGQVMAQPKPVFARIESPTTVGKDGAEGTKTVTKKKDKISQSESMVQQA